MFLFLAKTIFISNRHPENLIEGDFAKLLQSPDKIINNSAEKIGAYQLSTYIIIISDAVLQAIMHIYLAAR